MENPTKGNTIGYPILSLLRPKDPSYFSFLDGCRVLGSFLRLKKGVAEHPLEYKTHWKLQGVPDEVGVFGGETDVSALG